MRRLLLFFMVPILAVSACSGGGGNSFVAPPLVPWPRFRHDAGNTGVGSGPVAVTRPSAVPMAVDEGDVKSPVSASAAINVDGSVYTGSEGGTFKAFKANGDRKWATTSCEACPEDEQAIGRIVTSPAVYTLGTTTSLFLASKSTAAASGRAYVFEDAGDHAVCKVCFRPQTLDPDIKDASFVSSPNFTVHSLTLNVTGILLGAAIERTSNAGIFGKLYFLNLDGSLRWEYPRGVGLSAAITSSPSIVGGNIYFVGNDGTLYALTEDGSLRWQTPIGPVVDPDVDFALSNIGTSSLIYANTTSGDLVALESNGGAERWRTKTGMAFASSLVLGAQPVLVATETPTARPPTTPTPTPPVASSPVNGATTTPTPPPIATATATATITPTFAFAASTVFGIAKDGSVVVVDARTGAIVPTDLQEAIDGQVLSSPALTNDGYLIFASDKGTVYALNANTLTGAWTGVELSPDPTPEPIRVRSSAAIATDGTVWLGADDGNLYRLGTQ